MTNARTFTYEPMARNEYYDSQGERVHCEKCNMYPATWCRTSNIDGEYLALCPNCLIRERDL